MARRQEELLDGGAVGLAVEAAGLPTVHPRDNVARGALKTDSDATTPPSIPDSDLSTPEGEKAIRSAVGLVLELRDEETGPLARKVALYEKTLGLAVLPVLVRRAILNLWRSSGRRRRRPG